MFWGSIDTYHTCFEVWSECTGAERQQQNIEVLQTLFLPVQTDTSPSAFSIESSSVNGEDTTAFTTMAGAAQ